jgi:hypothetical protein
MMSLRERMQGALPVTAPLVLGPPMAKMAEAAGFAAGYLGGGATGYRMVVLEAKVYAELAQDFGSQQPKIDSSPVEHEMLGVIDIEKPLAVERSTVEKGKGA